MIYLFLRIPLCPTFKFDRSLSKPYFFAAVELVWLCFPRGLKLLISLAARLFFQVLSSAFGYLEDEGYVHAACVARRWHASAAPPVLVPSLAPLSWALPHRGLEAVMKDLSASDGTALRGTCRGLARNHVCSRQGCGHDRFGESFGSVPTPPTTAIAQPAPGIIEKLGLQIYFG